MKVKTIIVKAPNEEHKLILEKIGATEVMIPEKEIAHKVAKSLISPNVIDYLPLSDDYMISEMAPPNSFLGKSIAQLQLRSRYHIEVIAIRDVVSDKFQHGSRGGLRDQGRGRPGGGRQGEGHPADPVITTFLQVFVWIKQIEIA